MASRSTRAPLPPKPIIHLAWAAHRGLYRLSHGRFGLRRSRPDRWGTMQVTTTGRHSGLARTVILAYIEDGTDLVTMAMNGWDPAEPAWWLNLQADPHANVVLPDGSARHVSARAAHGEERDQLWDRYRKLTPHLDAYAARRAQTAIVVLEPDPKTPAQPPNA